MNNSNLLLVSSLFVLIASFVNCTFEPYEPVWVTFNDYDRANEIAEWSALHMEEYTRLEGPHKVMRIRESLKQVDSEIYFKFTIGIFG